MSPLTVLLFGLCVLHAHGQGIENHSETSNNELDDQKAETRRLAAGFEILQMEMLKIQVLLLNFAEECALTSPISMEHKWPDLMPRCSVIEQQISKSQHHITRISMDI